MSVVAFAGPSLTPADRAGFPAVRWRSPAEAGDLLRCGASAGDTVCLVDGAFDQRPAVRHKEVLWLLSRGVVVLGASSIGALRAAEMDGLGMIGIGAVFRAFRAGRIVGDDEVALVHGPESWNWRALSLPLVDVRGALHRAVRQRRLDPAEARALLDAARALHYADRDWDGVLGLSGLAPARRARIGDWLRAVPSQKRLDAAACIAAALTGTTAPPPPPLMVRTRLFDALARDCGLAPAAPPAPRSAPA